MLEFYFQDTDTIRRLRKGMFGDLIDVYARDLKAAGYSYQSAQQYIRLVEGFGSWLRYTKIERYQATSQHIERYIRYRDRHEQRTKCTGILTALKRIVALVVNEDACTAKRADKRTPAEKFADEFDHYLLKDRNLAQATTRTYCEFVKKFLKAQFKAGAVELSSLKTKNVLDFVRKEARLQSTLRAKLLVTALRSFFRYAKHKGYIVLDLEACVPGVPNWSRTEIPRALSEEKIKGVLTACKRNTSTGRRDFAILLLLARLGLRASEVSNLRLDDLDWKAGEVVIRGKGRKLCKMPLPCDVGEAIASYLKDGRRKDIESRILFLQRRAPFDRQVDISHVVSRAIARSGVETAQKGAHQFRHGLAVQMLKRGASLPEIGEVLRHVNVDTTTIYAKVDVAALRFIALPWPGGEQ
jgi:integrase/recombinase XerD